MPVGAAIGLKAADAAFNIAGGAIGSLINNAYYERNLQLQSNYQKELFDYEAAYNSPAAQMQRLAAAGLNPNLIYGSQSSVGNSGNVPSAPSGAMPSGSFSTADVSQIMLQLAESRNQDSAAARNIAEANYLNKQSGRYDELMDLTLEKDRKAIQEANSRMQLNASTITMQNANKQLTQAQTNYVNGQISLQEYERQRLVAETMLFQKKSTTEEYLAQSAEAEAAIKKLQAKYEELFYSGDRMKQMSDQEYNAMVEQWKKEAAVAAADASIEGSKVGRWISYVFDKIEILAKAGNQVSSTHRNFKR